MLKLDCKIRVTETNTAWAAEVTGKTEEYVRLYFENMKNQGLVCVMDGNLAKVERFDKENHDYHS